MSGLKQKTVKGFFWSSIDNIGSQGITVIVIIILARILSPAEFGIIGLTTIFIAIAQVLIEGGLGHALVREQDGNEKDYSTVFHFNVAFGILLYVLFYFLAPAIANFFGQPILVKVLRVLGLTLIIGSLTGIQQTILVKRIDFKSQAIISLCSASISGVVAIYLAFSGRGVWALVWRALLMQTIRSILFWIHNKWIPRTFFDKKTFLRLFSFGKNLVLIYLIAAIFKNIYNAIIGRFYKVEDVGYYSTADQYANMVGGTISNITAKVAYPVFSRLQSDPAALKNAAKKILGIITLCTFFIMFAIIIVAKPLIILLMGEKWAPAIPYLQALCLAYMVQPLHNIDQNIMNALGRSDLFLRTELVKYALFIPIIIVGIVWGIKVLMIGFIFHYWLGFFINAWYAKRLINFSIGQQLSIILLSIAIVGLPAALAVLSAMALPIFTDWLRILITLAIFSFCTFMLCAIIKPLAYRELVLIVKERLRRN
ncbi:MAG: lipopolysaccharide biosynthesis protein [Prevotellaceae bacterium]|jgi:O-antigen/teichoic acid export membrane protein|nr:lipopolysaccharide biosynthesis protein [Prevotellaceae bacterium]